MTTYFATGPFPCFQGVILLSLSALLGLGQTALELGLINALTVLALFLSYSMLNVCDLSTDGCFTLGALVGTLVAIGGRPWLSLPAAMFSCMTVIPSFVDALTDEGVYFFDAVSGFDFACLLIAAFAVIVSAKLAFAQKNAND